MLLSSLTSNIHFSLKELTKRRFEVCEDEAILKKTSRFFGSSKISNSEKWKRNRRILLVSVVFCATDVLFLYSIWKFYKRHQ